LPANTAKASLKQLILDGKIHNLIIDIIGNKKLPAKGHENHPK